MPAKRLDDSRVKRREIAAHKRKIPLDNISTDPIGKASNTPALDPLPRQPGPDFDLFYHGLEAGATGKAAAQRLCGLARVGRFSRLRVHAGATKHIQDAVPQIEVTTNRKPLRLDLSS
jgi:hypothetical protein